MPSTNTKAPLKDAWWWVIAIGCVCVVVGLSAWALLTIPNLIVDNIFKEYRENNVAIEQRALVSASSDARQAVTLAIGGIIALITFVLSLAKHRLSKQEHYLDQQKQNLENEKHESERDSLWANRYAEGIAQFTNQQSVSIRLGGIYSLERTAQESENDRQAILEVLCAYLRENFKSTHLEEEGAEFPRTSDFETAKTVREVVARILKMSPATRVDLTNVDLSGLDLEGVVLKEASLVGADLSGANLLGANFNGASLDKASFFKARLNDAKLIGAYLVDANFTEARMRSVSLNHALARRAIFDQANLREASFEEADLTNANFDKAKLRSTCLKSATLDGAFFTETNLTDTYFEESKINNTDFERSYVFEPTHSMNRPLAKSKYSSKLIFERQPAPKVPRFGKHKNSSKLIYERQSSPESQRSLTMNDLSQASFNEATPPRNVQKDPSL